MALPDRRVRRERIFFPSEPGRLALGFGVALAGPILAAWISSSSLLRDLPSPPQILVIVVATLLGRLFCGLVASVWAVVLINHYYTSPQANLGDPGGLASLGLFLLIAVVLSIVLARLDQARAAEAVLRDRERENQRRLDALLEASTALAGAVSREAIGRVLSDHTARLLVDGRAHLYVQNAHGVWEGLGEPAEDDLSSMLGEATPGGEALRSGLAVWLNDAHELARRFPDATGIASPGRAWVWFPISVRGDPTGLLMVAYEQPRAFDDVERSLLTSLARATNEALERASAYEEAVEARHDAERLQQVTAALSKASGRLDVASETLRTGMKVLGATAASFMVPSDERLEHLAMEGFSAEISERWSAVPIDADLPVVRAYLTGSPQIFERLDDWLTNFPHLITTVVGTGSVAITHHPLRLAGETIGVVSFSFEGEHVFSGQERAFLGNLAAQSAQALSRAQLLEAEASARRQAEDTSRRIQRIQLVTDAALSTLELEEMVPALLRRIQDILDADGATLLLATPDERWLIERDADPAHGTARVEIGRGVAGRIAATGEALMIPDLREWQTARPWLKREMRSLVGVPLRRGGRVIGVLHVTSRELGRFEADDLQLMELMAGRIASAIERANLFEQRDQMASALQRSLLPGELPQVPGLDVATLYQPYTPGDEVGGDFLDVFPQVEHGYWGALVGDVSGKGPEAAAIMGLARHSVRSLARFQTQPSVLLRTLNEIFIDDPSIPEARFVTMCYARILAGAGGARITLSLAGHPQPLLARADGTVSPVGRPGDLLGMFPDPDYHDDAFDMADGDRLVLYTDGLIEQRGIDLAVGMEHLTEALKASTGDSPEGTVAAIRREILDPRGARDDDVAILVFGCAMSR